ncbi:MAG: hypothetical protein KJI71_00015 [Patescibacteria group bacterium]|nr:hypothetical protein [Patescibacteria group bacterium]
MTKHTKPEHRRRTENINMAVTKSKKEFLENLAKEKEMTVFEYVRIKLFGG